MPLFKYIYSYSSTINDNARTLTRIDGILRLDNRVTNMEEYRHIKTLICPEKYDKLSIDSLSFLGREFILLKWILGFGASKLN